MKVSYGLLAVGVFALAACNGDGGTAPAASGGSAGGQGPGYCDSVPADPDDISNWEELCGEQQAR